ncbi:MAG: NADH-quinone oxidoreductase subunit NuoF [Anaerolinea sp.]|nr:NADH-quinone oxidoreductase subunit NuoF [Anaerolinea sp.]MCC6975610.1 NADH-quinone oxidoreductase subunit NuoF [Anaerolineae bacterium]CAG0949938.1 bidirectional [NiFe] hydrogenase diaphorase subunit [Anaerolineae bacterium]
MIAEELSKTAAAEREAQAQFEHRINVCVAASCLSSNSDKIKSALETEVKKKGLEKSCQVRGVGCMRLCSRGPLVSTETQGEDETQPASVLYQNVTPEDAPALVESLKGEPVKALECPTDTPFFKSQVTIVLENSGKIDPERIEEYIAVEGYATLLKALTTMTPAEVIAEISRSGLRGRGGAGYSTGLKWTTVAKANGGSRKYVICNADEGDPGAFMDRSVLESDPHRILEGMALAAYAVGASHGYIYVRAEYPLAIKRLRAAIRQAERNGLLGTNISGTTFSFTVELRLGAGAFVCGEETALIASIEGKRGQPRPRPPYPAESGVWGCPTLINNVETFANIVPIIREGGDWFAGIGTAKSKGTKVFALTGQIHNTGLIEVPMGTPLREIVYEIGGGIPGGKAFKAVQTGGPSGGCIPAQHLDSPVDYESLIQLGSFMGSGGMIIMDETSCMVDVATYFMEFCMSESCGKCVPCRVGTAHMYDLLQKITRGEATMADLDLLLEVCDVVKNTSLCGLGMGAPQPIFSTLRYFRDEYLAHIEAKQCPAGVCKIHEGNEEVIA